MARYEEQRWQADHSLRLDINYMMADLLGTQEGIKKEDIEGLMPRITEAERALKEKRSELAWRDLPYSQAEAAGQIKDYARIARTRFSNFVVLGIGGSALGPLAVHKALNHQAYNLLSRERRGGFPRFFVLDNIDPEGLAGLLDVLDPGETLFNVITKSGTTAETMAQFLVFRDLLQQRVGKEYAENLVATTDRDKGSLVKIAKEKNIRLFYIPEKVGGRFSELSPVGLLPAAMTGIDIDELLAGAAFMDKWIEQSIFWHNPAYLRAVLHYLALHSGKNISVMMPYADSLKYFADWYAQLWAESLGKRFDRSGEEVWQGQTPVKALGVTDQHSQLQLFTEGPFDKVVNFLAVQNFNREVSIPTVQPELEDLAFLSGKTLNALLDSERRATEYALFKAGRPSNTLILPRVNEFTIGQLIYLLEVETAFAGELLNLDAFDQPGVEEGKKAAYALMGKPGFESLGKKLNDGMQKQAEYLVTYHGTSQ